jgi:cell division cycle protein 20 (cofactor of APC complex)
LEKKQKMAQFNYLNDINALNTMDSEMTKGPAPRWQRKLDASTSMNTSQLNSSKQKLSMSYNAGTSFSLNMTGSAGTSKTPRKTSNPKKTPSKGK